MIWDASGDAIVCQMPDGRPYFEPETAAFIVALANGANCERVQADVHPEDSCADCGRSNITWHTDSPVWNLVMRREGQPEPVLCPACFGNRAKEQGIESWKLIPDPLIYGEAVQGSVVYFSSEEGAKP
jgi:hypothetical protein